MNVGLLQTRQTVHNEDVSLLFSFLKPVELMNDTPREHSLICKGPVEVLVLDKEVRIAARSTVVPSMDTPNKLGHPIMFTQCSILNPFCPDVDDNRSPLLARELRDIELHFGRE